MTTRSNRRRDAAELKLRADRGRHRHLELNGRADPQPRVRDQRVGAACAAYAAANGVLFGEPDAGPGNT
jgi:hypothetical protein